MALYRNVRDPREGREPVRRGVAEVTRPAQATLWPDRGESSLSRKERVVNLPMVCSRIRALREDSDQSQTQLARRLGMSQAGYSKYETGENEVPTSILIRLSEMYQTSVDYLLGLTDERRPYPRRKRR